MCFLDWSFRLMKEIFETSLSVMARKLLWELRGKENSKLKVNVGENCGEGRKAGKFHRGAWRVTVHGVTEGDTDSQQQQQSLTQYF